MNSPSLAVKGGIPTVIRNDEKLYEGNLIPYFRALFFHARNLNHPYHNLRHILHVTYLGYLACEFYREKLSPRELRNMMIAFMFHDFDHIGLKGDDDVNISLATRALKKHLQPEDREYFEAIKKIIEASQFPYLVPTAEVSLEAQILRDADVSQVLSVAWVQQVVIGLASEWERPPIDIMRVQVDFLTKLKFHTTWANEYFGPDAVREKLGEVQAYLDILELDLPTAQKA